MKLIPTLVPARAVAMLNRWSLRGGPFFSLALWLLVSSAPLQGDAVERRLAGKLLGAASKGDTLEVKALLRAGANPNETDQERWSPLMAAAVRGDEDSTAALLKSGARVDWRNDLQRTPLMLTAWRGHVGVMRRLLEAGANPNARSKGRWSPLIYAVDGRHAGAVKLLLAHGADPRVQGLGYTSAMSSACGYGNSEMIEALVKAGANVNARTHGGARTMLGMAAGEAHVEAVETLLRLGAEASPAMAPYSTPLRNAIQRRGTTEDPNTPRVIALLLKAGARPSVEDLQTAVYLERIDLHCPMTHLLLDAGVDLAARDSLGSTALHNAAALGSAAAVELLLKKGADIDALDRMGSSAIVRAIGAGRADIVNVLIRSGARLVPEGTAGNQRSPLARAAATGHPAMIRSLVAAGAKANGVDAAQALFFAAKSLDAPTIDALLEAGADPNFTHTGSPWTPLAIALGDPQPGEALRVDDRPDSGRVRTATDVITRRLLTAPGLTQAAKTNALIHASARQPLSIIRLLVEAGADPHGADMRFGSPAENAARNPDPQVKAFFQTLQ